ncbi:hypothetical protein T552_02292 [Pneumocystis carinii B80]|uniref:Uncharacterized protein n=1 Tax=Pneumocystis carinii (strain B80) TaxID=1408658 RepID=A0A0W4ZG05_PNEC8|nr:hypothetical protein T552_02292 [Pneumocystis carinii B80]KTW27310.1 hypothetical protein T552_02292 [Pneumocystis carinii B80]
MDEEEKEVEVLKNGQEVVKKFKKELMEFLRNFLDINYNVEKIVCPLNIFQEQPELLDCELENLVHPVIDIIIKEIKNKVFCEKYIYINRLCYILYIYTKICGFKTIVKYFYNDFYIFESILFYMQNIPQEDTELWITRYIFLLWLSLLCMIPFDLSKIDSNISVNTNIIYSLLILCKHYLSVCGKEQDAASILAGRLLTRKDTYKLYLPSFITWIRDTWILETTSDFMKIGLISSLCNIFKSNDRNFLLTIANDTFLLLQLITRDKHSNDRIRHLITKLFQRVCLCFLKPYEASWIYKIEHNSLAKNLGTKDTDIQELSTDIDDMVLHPAIEECLYLLLENISDTSTIVRYSSAKGISRIISHIPESSANKVISAVISSIKDLDGSYSIKTSNDIAWHGVCMTIAEFCRRGLLLPYRLKEILPILLKALTFEQRRGTQYLGNNVRDAACYISWSIFRRYSVDNVTYLFPMLAESLLMVAIFDKETNIRRAASSAYQEGVGRYGESIFPHGIEIIREMNFYTLATIRNSYLNVCFNLFKFNKYQDLIISYLTEKMAYHYDKKIRELSSQILGKIAEINPSIVSKTIPFLIMNFEKKDIIMQHGTLEILAKTLTKIQSEDISSDIIQKFEKLICEEVLPKDTLRVYPDMYESICRYIIEISNTKYAKEACLLYWMDYIKCSLRIDNIHYEASQAISSLAKRFDLHAELNEFIIYIKSNYNKQDTFTDGLLCALGKIEYFEKYQDILELLVHDLIEITPLSDITFKKNSIKTLGEILYSSKKYSSLSSFDIQYLHLDKLIQLFLDGLNDYSTGIAGDIGSCVRRESMISVFYILELTFNHNIDYFLTDTIFHSIIGNILRHTVEKLDNLRVVAGTQFVNIVNLYQNMKKSYFSESIELIKNALEKIHDWRIPRNVIPNIIQLLCIKEYQEYILMGLINSINGNESLAKEVEHHLTFYLVNLPIEKNHSNSLTLLDFANLLLKLCDLNIANNNFMICFMIFCNILFERLIFESLVGIFDFKHFFNSIRKSSCKSKSIQKISLSIKIYVGISKLSIKTASESLNELLLLLQHSYPVIRTRAAEGLYMVLTEKELNISDEELYSNLINILIKTSWMESIEENKQHVEILQNSILNL